MVDHKDDDLPADTMCHTCFKVLGYGCEELTKDGHSHECLASALVHLFMISCAKRDSPMSADQVIAYAKACLDRDYQALLDARAAENEDEDLRHVAPKGNA